MSRPIACTIPIKVIRTTWGRCIDAHRGKTSIGWFYGFKLHLVVDDRSEILAFCLTPCNVDDRHPVPRLVRRLFGKQFGEEGYFSHALAEQFFLQHGLQLITKLKWLRMRNRLLHVIDKFLLRKRAIIESVTDQLKNVCHGEHSHHRSPMNFVVHLMVALTAYCRQSKKPSLHMDLQVCIVV